MRVIAGKYKGHALMTLSGKNTRPTSAVTREALFQMLGPFFPSGIVIDLYAGSGALGIEAVSRGMNQAYLIENNQQATQVIQKNIDALRAQDMIELLKMSVIKGLYYLNDMGVSADLILLDPPYGADVQIDLEYINDLSILRDGGVLVAETDSATELAECIGDLTLITMKDYGLSRLHFYRMARDNEMEYKDD